MKRFLDEPREERKSMTLPQISKIWVTTVRIILSTLYNFLIKCFIILILDDLEHYVDFLTKDIELPKGAHYEAFSHPDDGIFINLETRKRMNVSNPTILSNEIFVKTTANVGLVATGEMMFGASAIKEECNTGSNTYIFTVVYGRFEVIINGQKRLEKGEGSTFVIDPDHNYSIRNRSGKRAELTFSLTPKS